jgi:hypothetical protein
LQPGLIAKCAKAKSLPITRPCGRNLMERRPVACAFSARFSPLPHTSGFQTCWPHRPGSLCSSAPMWVQFYCEFNAQLSTPNVQFRMGHSLDVERWALNVGR